MTTGTIDGLTLGEPTLVGNRVKLPITNPGAPYNHHINFRVFLIASSTGSPGLKYCYTSDYYSIASGNSTVWCDATQVCCPSGASWLYAVAKIDSGTTGHSVSAGSYSSFCAKVARSIGVQGSASDQSASYFSFPVTNFSDRHVRTKISVKPLTPNANDPTFVGLLDDLDLMTAMANRDLTFGDPHGYNLWLGPESRSVPPERGGPPERACGCTGPGQLDPHHEPIAASNGPTYGLLSSADRARLVGLDPVLDKEGRISANQLPWQESQVLLRVDLLASERKVAVFRCESQQVPLDVGGTNKPREDAPAEPVHSFDVVVLPSYKPFA